LRILADENFPGDAVHALRHRGHDVVWVHTSMPAASDKIVLAHAGEQGRLLITFDKDFGDLAFHHGLSAECGVVLFRISLSDPALAAHRIGEILEDRADWSGHFTCVEDDRIRMRPLPRRARDGDP
jgi:hypothetical protein